MAIQSVYKGQHQWHPWLFEKVPAGYWEDDNNIKLFMGWVGKELKIGENNMDEWYRVSSNQLAVLGGIYMYPTLSLYPYIIFFHQGIH